MVPLLLINWWFMNPMVLWYYGWRVLLYSNHIHIPMMFRFSLSKSPFLIGSPLLIVTNPIMHPIRFPNILINFGMYNDIPIVHDIPKWYFHGGFANSWVKKNQGAPWDCPSRHGTSLASVFGRRGSRGSCGSVKKNQKNDALLSFNIAIENGPFSSLIYLWSQWFSIAIL